MKEVIQNLALIHAMQFCKDNNIDCAGSHLVKDGRGYSYTLKCLTSGARIVTVTLYKNQTPRFTAYRTA